MTTQYSLFFIQRFKGKVLFDVPMSEYTTLRIGGPAEVMVFPRDEGDLKELLIFARTRNFPVFILGSGANLLVRDGGIRGIVVNMTEGFDDISWQAGGRAVVGAGVVVSRLLNECAERGLSGLEFAAGIPGTVGGAVSMNAGAYGGEMKDVVDGVEVMGARGSRPFKLFLTRDDLRFGYRKAEIPPKTVIIRAHMSFKRSTPGEVRERIGAVRERRRLSAKIDLPSAGSVFKNPDGISAGELIDRAGLKGLRRGDAQISEVHANYIVNLGKAKARDVLGLMAVMRDRVYRNSGVLLEPEIKVVGEDL